MPLIAKAYARLDAWYMRMPKGVQYPVAAVMWAAVLFIVVAFLGLLERLDELPWWAEWPIIAVMVLAVLVIVATTNERSERRKRESARTATAAVVQANPQVESPTVTKRLAQVAQNNAQALIIAAGLIIAGLLWGGVYTARSGPRGLAIFRVNRFTGAVVVCIINQACKDEGMATPTPAPDVL